MAEPVTLELTRAVKHFGGIRAVDDVSFTVMRGETFGIVGANGAGKTALLNCISAVYRLTSGAIELNGLPIQHLSPHEVAARGIARSFQGTEHFRSFRAFDYVMLGRLTHLSHSVVRSALPTPSMRRREREEGRVVTELLGQVGLGVLKDTAMNELPYGVQKLLDLVRAIAASPQLLLLDEPTSGTTATERKVIASFLGSSKPANQTRVIVDHNVEFVLEQCDRLLVMSLGKVLAVGEPREVLQRSEVVDAYLGAHIGSF